MLRRLFTNQHIQGRTVVTIRVYLDESEGETAYLAAGWACRSERWDAISDAWQSALDAAPSVPYFKINEAMGLKGPFTGWDVTVRDEKVATMVKSIPHDEGLFGHGCYVDPSDFEIVRHELRRVYRSPYFSVLRRQWLSEWPVSTR
jgi:hypothetical protein